MVLSSFLFVTLRFLLGHALLFQKSGFLLLAQHLFGSMFFVAQHAININSLFIYTRLLLHIFSFNCCRDHKQAAVFKRYKELSSRGRARTKWYFTVHRLSRRSEIVAESKTYTVETYQKPVRTLMRTLRRSKRWFIFQNTMIFFYVLPSCSSL